MPTTRRKSMANSAAKSRRSQVAESTDTHTQHTGTVVSEQHVQSPTQSQSGEKTTKRTVTTTETRIIRTPVVAPLGINFRYSPTEYPPEPWELAKNKTDYTYARTPLYHSRYDHLTEWQMPNMSRPRLRDGAPVFSPTSSSASNYSDLLSVSQTNIHSGYTTHHREMQDSNTTHASSSGRRTSRALKNIEKHEVDETIPYKTLPASTTRSGRSRDGTRRSSRRATTSQTADVTEYMELEKQMEYSGQAGPYKEASRVALFGLDQEEDEVDTRYMHRQSNTYTESVITSFWIMITTIVTIWTSVWETSCHVVTSPVRLLRYFSDTSIGFLHNVLWRVGAWIHGAAAHVILIDAWLLSSMRERRRSVCCCLLPLFLLLLLLPAVLYPVFQGFVREQSSATILAADTVKAAEQAGISPVLLREIIQKELLAAKADVKLYGEKILTEGASQHADHQVYMTRLETRLKDQAILLAQLKECCNQSLLAGIVRDRVQHELAGIMLGGDGSGSSSSDRSVSHTTFMTWLDSRFSQSGELDAKIATITATLNAGLKEQAEASRAAMLAVIESNTDNQAQMALQKEAQIAAQVELQALKAALAAHVARFAAQTETNNIVHRVDKSRVDTAEIARILGLLQTLELTQGAQVATWAQDKEVLETKLAALTVLLQATNNKADSATLAAQSANTAATAATETAQSASYTAQSASNDASMAAAAAALLQEQSESNVGVAIGTGCGCDQQGAAVLPDNFQGISQDQVRQLIRDALVLFGADKTGMVDYALESAGGSVISTRCSETYHRRTAQLSLFGIPLWYLSNSPRTVIQPDMQPGQCWAFKGSQGYMVIQLAGLVKPTAFSLEHIPKTLSPTGRIDSATKDFTVWGLKYERDIEGVLLGNYTYLDNDEPLQYFLTRDPDVGAYHIVELRIHSNHGNQEYTCLYRFRVHGVLK